MPTLEPTPRHIMVVNSEDAFLIAVRMLLEDEGYLVTTGSYQDHDPFPGIVAVDPALIILDFVHGETGGWELLARLDSDRRTNTIPLMATSTDQNLLDRVMEQPASLRMRTFLLKPLDLECMVTDVARLLQPA